MFDFMKRNRKRASKEMEARRTAMAARAAENRRRAEKHMEHAHHIYRSSDDNDTSRTRDDVPYYINHVYEPTFTKQIPYASAVPSELRIEGVKAIKRDQYRDREQITSVFIGPEVECIGASAFEGCKNLRKVEFSKGLKVIGQAAFADCPLLEDFVLPSTLVALSVPIEQNEKTRTIQLPASMQSCCSGYESKGSFEGCKRITHVEIPDGVRVIPIRTFAKCYHLKNVVFPPNVIIERMAFAKCKRLENVDFSRVRAIGVEAFQKCESIREVVLMGGVRVDSHAFSDCTSLERVYVSKEAQFGTSAFVDCPNLTRVEFPAENDLRIPVFYNCPLDEDVLLGILRCTMPGLPGNARVDQFIGVQKMVIPEGVTNIKKEAFAYNQTIQELTLPSSLRTIGDSAYEGVKHLEEIHFSKGLVCIGERAFRYCNPDFLDFPEGLTEIGAYAFESKDVIHTIDNNDVLRVILPTSLKHIGEGAFRNNRMHALLLNNGVESIGEEAFANTPLEIAVLHNDLSEIPAKLFYGCKNMKWVQLPAALKSIGASAFEGTALEKIQFPSGLERIDALAFGDCKGLKEVKLPDGIVHVDSTAFVNCSLAYLDYPDSVHMPAEDKKRSFCPQIAEAQRNLRASYHHDIYVLGLDSEGKTVYGGISDSENLRARLCGYPQEVSVPAHCAHLKSQFPDAVKFNARKK